MTWEVTVENVTAYLHGRGLLRTNTASVQELGGGVSSRVLLVAAPGERLVVKQPLPRFRVQDEWLVDTRRVQVESEFLRRIGERLPPNAVAPFVDFDEASQTLIMKAVAPTFGTWKARLLARPPDADLGRSAAKLLATIHRIGLDEPSLRLHFDHPQLFDQQRIDPYLRTLETRHPRCAPALGPVIRELETQRITLVHGDFSPKNILTDGRTLTLVDHEVATWNDPLFDVCFFVNHLLLKSFHRPMVADEILECAQTFLETYRSEAPPACAARLAASSHLLPALLLARVDGKSPVEYLSAERRIEVRERALRWLTRAPRATPDYATGTA